MAGNRFHSSKFVRWLVARLREPVRVDAEALARVKAAVRARAPTRAARRSF